MPAKIPTQASTSEALGLRLALPDWAGAVAGFLGVSLLLAVELAANPAHQPTVRYTPPIRPGNGTAMEWQPITFVALPTVDELQAAFQRVGYDLDETRRKGVPVPRLRLSVLPRDLPDVMDIERRKIVFLSLLLPLVLEANARVAMERRRLRYVIDLRAKGKAVPEDLADWVAVLAKRYKGSPDQLDRLLLRVDTVPPSLVLAQAAAESGWGTSRFAIEGNAIFGQWTTAGGKGLVPRGRPAGETYKVRSFERPIDSVDAYLLNLNTHRSYRGFRIQRARLRRSAGAPDGSALAGELRRYSQQRGEYVTLLRDIILKNRLRPFDRARLGDTAVEPARNG